MKIEAITEGRVVRYVGRKYTGKGPVIQVYPGATGPWVIVHDKVRNKSITLRISQVFPR